MSRWIFMTVVYILFPLAMIILGLWFRVRPPGRPQEKEEVWRFAQHHLARTWLILGGPLLALSVGALLLVIRQRSSVIFTVGIILNGFQTLVLFSSSLPTQRAMRRHFDGEGNPREQGSQETESQVEK